MVQPSAPSPVPLSPAAEQSRRQQRNQAGRYQPPITPVQSQRTALYHAARRAAAHANVPVRGLLYFCLGCVRRGHAKALSKAPSASAQELSTQPPAQAPLLIHLAWVGCILIFVLEPLSWRDRTTMHLTAKVDTTQVRTVSVARRACMAGKTESMGSQSFIVRGAGVAGAARWRGC